MTKFEKETRQQLPGIHFHKKTTTIKLAKCGTTACAHDKFCPLPQA